MLLTFDGVDFVARGRFDQRREFKRLGFKFINKRWVTPNPQVAVALRAFADERAEEKIRRSFIQYAPWRGRIPIPKGKELAHGQKRAIIFALSRNHSFLALDPGMGKTVVAIVALNALGPHPVIMVVKPSLCAHWRATIPDWSTWPAKSQRMIQIIPDSLVVDPLGDRAAIFDMIEDAGRLGGATLIIEEAHRFKNPESQRTQAVLGERGLCRHFDRIALLSGTHSPNLRPMELYPALSRLAPETIGFRNYYRFGHRYCDPQDTGFGFEFKGATHVDELMGKVNGTFMLRLEQKLKIKKFSEIVVLAEKAPAKVVALEKEIVKTYSKKDLMRGVIVKRHRAYKDPSEDDGLSLASYRRYLGLAKTPLVISFVKELLEDDEGESMLLFATHTEVIKRLAKGLARFQPLVMTGETKMRDRQPIVDKFQSDPRHRIFIGNEKVAGEGYTLTKARFVGRVEPGWVPGDNKQVSNRAYRHGQKRDVYDYAFVFENSLDGSIIKLNLRKEETTQLK